VLDRLGISENTLKVWRKQQLAHRAAAFEDELHAIVLMAREGRRAREHAKKLPEFRILAEAYDQQCGLAALDWVAKAIKDLGAHKGQK
jgi:transposase-like protein